MCHRTLRALQYMRDLCERITKLRKMPRMQGGIYKDNKIGKELATIKTRDIVRIYNRAIRSEKEKSVKINERKRMNVTIITTTMLIMMVIITTTIIVINNVNSNDDDNNNNDYHETNDDDDVGSDDNDDGNSRMTTNRGWRWKKEG
jgi:hypothetical protein